jgi:hypothetical protein
VSFLDGGTWQMFSPPLIERVEHPFDLLDRRLQTLPTDLNLRHQACCMFLFGCYEVHVLCKKVQRETLLSRLLMLCTFDLEMGIVER